MTGADVERAARLVYKAMQAAARGSGIEPPEWVPGGNSDMQDVARRAAFMIEETLAPEDDDARLRFICQEVDIGAARNVGGPVDVDVCSFTDVAKLAGWLRFDGLPEEAKRYATRRVMGVEVLDDDEASDG